MGKDHSTNKNSITSLLNIGQIAGLEFQYKLRAASVVLGFRSQSYFLVHGESDHLSPAIKVSSSRRSRRPSNFVILSYLILDLIGNVNNIKATTPPQIRPHSETQLKHPLSLISFYTYLQLEQLL